MPSPVKRDFNLGGEIGGGRGEETTTISSYA